LDKATVNCTEIIRIMGECWEVRGS